MALDLTRADGGPLMMIGLGIAGATVGGVIGISVLDVGWVTAGALRFRAA